MARSFDEHVVGNIARLHVLDVSQHFDGFVLLVLAEVVAGEPLEAFRRGVRPIAHLNSLLSHFEAERYEFVVLVEPHRPASLAVVDATALGTAKKVAVPPAANAIHA